MESGISIVSQRRPARTIAVLLAGLATLACASGRVAVAAELPPPGLPPAETPATAPSAPSAPAAAAAAPAGSTAPSAPAAAPARAEPALPSGAQPVADDTVDNPIPPARVVSPEPRIQQLHNGRRVAEVIVVPAGTSLRYTLANHDGPRQPTSPLDTTSNLSTQRFFRVDF